MTRKARKRKQESRRAVIDWKKVSDGEGQFDATPKCMGDLVNKIFTPSPPAQKIFIAGPRGTAVMSNERILESSIPAECTTVVWNTEIDATEMDVQPACLPARELRTHKPVTQPVPILPILRWGTMPDDPNLQLLECNSIKELIATLIPTFEQCLSFNITTSLIVVGLPDLAEVSEANDWDRCDMQEQQIIDEIFHAIREFGMLIRFDRRFLALFLLRVDQLTASKVCQRIKEGVRRLAYFKFHLRHEPALRFGVSDHKSGTPGNAERLVREALRNMDLAEHLGGGAIVREVDKNLSLERAREDAHFSVGDVWLRQLKQTHDDF